MSKNTRKDATPQRATPERREPVLALPAECLIANAPQLRTNLVALLDQPDAVTLDASAVERIDTACLQVLTAFASERRAASKPISWTGVTPTLAERAQLLDLQTALGLPAKTR